MFVCVLWQIPNPPEDEEEQEQEEAGKVAEWGDSKLDRLKDLLGFLLEYFISNKDVAKFFIDHVDARCFPEDKEVSVRGRMKGWGGNRELRVRTTSTSALSVSSVRCCTGNTSRVSMKFRQHGQSRLLVAAHSLVFRRHICARYLGFWRLIASSGAERITGTFASSFMISNQNQTTALDRTPHPSTSLPLLLFTFRPTGHRRAHVLQPNA